jgi:hypothetical protein
MMPSDRIENVIRNTRTTTNAAMDERINAAVEAAKMKSNEKSPATIYTIGVTRRNIMNSKWTKLATAAAIIVAVALGMYALTGSVNVTSITMAQIRDAMEDIDWMQIVNKGGEENKSGAEPEVDWFSFASKVHIKTCQGIIEYHDFMAGKKLCWNPAGEYIIESKLDPKKDFALGADGPFEMMDKSLLHAAHGSDVVKKRGTYNGQHVEIWTASNNVNGKSDHTRTLTVYIDIERKLPIAATYDHNFTDGKSLRESNIEFHYPKAGPADIYEVGAPRSAMIESDSE